MSRKVSDIFIKNLLKNCWFRFCSASINPRLIFNKIDQTDENRARLYYQNFKTELFNLLNDERLLEDFQRLLSQDLILILFDDAIFISVKKLRDLEI